MNTTLKNKKLDDKASPKKKLSKSGKPASRGKKVSFSDKRVTTSESKTKQNTVRKARLEARITHQAQTTIKRAAEIQGRTVTDFVVDAALEAARKTIEKNHIIRLSLEGQKAFTEALLNPPEPNDSLKKAFERHSELFGDKD